ncbi:MULTISPECIES: hypothetical protein [Sphingobacterium]|uniref:hypothetical protein n=1 Tax=Sphingobacterium TaxID=28453 RepID=UPI00285F87FB|nr:hypothetical protein [Sphingobacterium sp. 2149]MDR6733522.1 hypothetical protein [Sphingobacterium sp. 2149]
MITDQTTPEDFINDRQSEYGHIKGWGIDFDPKNDPTYPIKKRNNQEHQGYSWQRPPLQEETVEILHSVERPNLTAVYGTGNPPKGLSGAIRRIAFKYSESSYGRWLPLVLADRVDMLEGVVEDIAKGHLPNIAKELGLGAEWKYNKKAFIGKTVVAGLLIGLVAFQLCSKRENKR